MEELPKATEEAHSGMEAASTQNEEDNYSSNRPGQSLQVQFLGEQTNIYEELDQLVEQMIQDKTAVTLKISELEENVKGLQQQKHLLEEANAALRQQNSNLQQDLDSQQEPNMKVIQEANGLDDALTSARKELQEMKQQVEILTGQLAHARDASAELKEKLLETETECKNLARTLVVEQSENTQLSCLKEQCTVLRKEKDELNITQKKLQHRLTASQNELHALKGRATNKQKYVEHLKTKCSSLQSALELVSSRTPTVVKLSPSPQRTREELRLREECWKKDEMLASSAKELSVCQEEQRRRNFQLCNVMKSVKVERSKAGNLSKAMENLREEKEEVEKELKQKSREYARDLVARRAQEQDEFYLGKADVETNLSRIERELEVVKGVVGGLRWEVEWKEGKWKEERMCWKDERTRLIKMCEEAVKAKKELGEGGLELIETKDNYRRLKVVSTRRCTELASEVWSLKNQLKEQQASTTKIP